MRRLRTIGEIILLLMPLTMRVGGADAASQIDGASAVFKAKAGEILPVIRTRFGYHIVKVESHVFASDGERVKAHNENPPTTLGHASALGAQPTASELQTKLLRAARESDTAAVKVLLAEGAPPDSKDERGETALMTAASRGDLAMVKALMDAGADVNAKATGINALWFSLVNRSTDKLAIVKALLDKGADMQAANPSGLKPLAAAIGFGDPDVVRAFLDKGFDVNANDVGGSRGATPLVIAVSNSGIEMVRLLLDRGADIHAQTADGRTAMMAAARRADHDILELLATTERRVSMDAPPHPKEPVSPATGTVEVNGWKLRVIGVERLTDWEVPIFGEHYKPSRPDWEFLVVHLRADPVAPHTTKEDLEPAFNSKNPKTVTTVAIETTDGKIYQRDNRFVVKGATYDAHSEFFSVPPGTRAKAMSLLGIWFDVANAPQRDLWQAIDASSPPE